jgi:hypothetical protein
MKTGRNGLIHEGTGQNVGNGEGTQASGSEGEVRHHLRAGRNVTVFPDCSERLSPYLKIANKFFRFLIVSFAFGATVMLWPSAAVTFKLDALTSA